MPRRTSNNASSSSRRMLYMAAQAGEAVQEVQDDDMIDIEIREEHTIRVHETEDYFKAESTVKEHFHMTENFGWFQKNLSFQEGQLVDVLGNCGSVVHQKSIHFENLN